MRAAAILALIAVAAACTPQPRTFEGRELSRIGNPAIFDDAILARIIEGKSSKADVRELLGEPNDVSFASDGAETWRYVAGISRMQAMTVSIGGYTGGQTEMDTRTVTLLFSEGGIVRKFGLGRSRSCGGPGGAPASC